MVAGPHDNPFTNHSGFPAGLTSQIRLSLVIAWRLFREWTLVLCNTDTFVLKIQRLTQPQHGAVDILNLRLT